MMSSKQQSVVWEEAEIRTWDMVVVVIINGSVLPQ